MSVMAIFRQPSRSATLARGVNWPQAVDADHVRDPRHGLLAIILSLVVFFTTIWKLAIIGILIGIFLFGRGVGFWFFSQGVYR